MQVGEPEPFISHIKVSAGSWHSISQSFIYQRCLEARKSQSKVHEHVRHTQRGSLKICSKTAKAIRTIIKNLKKSLQVMVKMIYNSDTFCLSLSHCFRVNSLGVLWAFPPGKPLLPHPPPCPVKSCPPIGQVEVGALTLNSTKFLEYLAFWGSGPCWSEKEEAGDRAGENKKHRIK